jgi:tRNA A-37 threonylcarbamoyl transferase component Bud32
MLTVVVDDSLLRQDPPDLLPSGAKVGPWRIESQLGRGGMGTVYAVVHDEIGKRAALKLLHKSLCARDLDVERILLEAKVVNQVRHPDIVDIFETGRLDDGRPYIVMERLEGESLHQRAHRSKLLPDQVVEILRQICEAVIAAHDAGIIHRDLKVDNVFLVECPAEPGRLRVKVLDWGIAKVIGDDVRHTLDGQIVGTPHYVAPEQARGHEATAKTDVYAIGVMAYQLFLEELPFEAETPAEILMLHLRAQPRAPRELWPEIPASLEALLLAMLAKDADARPTVAEVIASLDAVAGELAVRRRPPTIRPTPRALTAPQAVELAATQPLQRVSRARQRYAGAGGFAAIAAAVAIWIGRGGDGRAAMPAAAATGASACITGAPAAAPPGETVVASRALAPAPQATVARSAPAPLAKAAPRATATAGPQGPQAGGRSASPPTTSATLARSAPPQSPGKARRALPLDPDGTVDAYR